MAKIDPDVPVECGKCGHKNNRPMSSLHDGCVVTCVCGTKIAVRAPDLAEVQASFRSLENSLNKLGRRR